MIEFHNPQGQRAVPADPYTLGIDLAANPPSVVGLLANGFPDSENFLRHVGCELERLIDGIEVRVWNKGNASIALQTACWMRFKGSAMRLLPPTATEAAVLPAPCVTASIQRNAACPPLPW